MGGGSIRGQSNSEEYFAEAETVSSSTRNSFGMGGGMMGIGDVVV